MGRSSPPKNEPIAARPKSADKAVQEAQKEAVERRRTARGYRSTILSKNMMTDDVQQRLATLGS